MKYIFTVLIAYFLGSLSFAFILGKLIMKKDVRNFGSGNSGATNAIRAFGAKMGVAAFVCDLLKGVLAVFIGRMLIGENGGYLAGAMVIIGHNWPIFLKFKGGKGVATTIGVMLIISPILSLICFSIGFLLAFFTRTVSLGSVTGMAISPIVTLILIRPFNTELFLFVLFVAGLSIYRHKENIKRLISGKENKL